MISAILQVSASRDQISHPYSGKHVGFRVNTPYVMLHSVWHLTGPPTLRLGLIRIGYNSRPVNSAGSWVPSAVIFKLIISPVCNNVNTLPSVARCFRHVCYCIYEDIHWTYNLPRCPYSFLCKEPTSGGRYSSNGNDRRRAHSGWGFSWAANAGILINWLQLWIAFLSLYQ